MASVINEKNIESTPNAVDLPNSFASFNLIIIAYTTDANGTNNKIKMCHQSNFTTFSIIIKL